MLINAIADLLAAEGLGTVGTNLFVGHLPQEPDTALAIFPTGGFPADGTYPLDEPTFQLRSRSLDWATGYGLLTQAYTELHGLHHTTLDGHWVVNCLGLQSAPTGIGRDEAGREEFTINFRLEVRRD
jgi:hypothetical protein